MMNSLLYRIRFSGHKLFLGRPGDGVLGEPLGFDLPGAEKAVLFHRPFPVVSVHKTSDRRPNLLEILKPPAMDDLLFEGPVEAFSRAIGLWWFDKGETWTNPPVFEVKTLAPSVPHMGLGAWVMLSPSWRRGLPRRPR